MNDLGSVPPIPPDAPQPHRPRRRDRHGRGMRGPVAPPQVPLAVSRADSFDSLVHDSAERLRRRLPQLAGVDFAVQEVPRLAGNVAGDEGNGELTVDVGALESLDPFTPAATVPLGGVVRSGGERPARIVVYRRPVELRSRDREERALLVHEVVVEQAAELLGLAPESVDPGYGQD